MQINYRVSKVYKLIDIFTNKIILDANVIIKGSNIKALGKNDGFYLFCNLPEGNYEIIISAKGYKDLKTKLEIKSNETPLMELIELEPEENLGKAQDRIVLEGKLVKSEKKFDYCIIRKDTMYRVIKACSKGEDLLYLKFSQNISLEYRNIIIEGVPEIYTIQSYDFSKNAYVLDRELEKDIEAGENVYLSSKGITDKNGNYNIVAHKDFTDKNGICNIIFVVGTKQIKKEHKI